MGLNYIINFKNLDNEYRSDQSEYLTNVHSVEMENADLTGEAILKFNIKNPYESPSTVEYPLNRVFEFYVFKKDKTK